MIESAIENIGGIHFLGIGMTPDSAFELLQGKAVRVRFKGLCITLWRSRTKEQLQRDLQVYENGQRLPIMWIDAPLPEAPDDTIQGRVESTRDQTRTAANALSPVEFILRVLENLTFHHSTFDRVDWRAFPSRVCFLDRYNNEYGYVERCHLEAVIAEVLQGKVLQGKVLQGKVLEAEAPQGKALGR